MFTKKMLMDVYYSILKLISTVRCGITRKEIAWDATVEAYARITETGGDLRFRYWRLVAYHRAIDLLRQNASRIDVRLRKHRVCEQYIEDFAEIAESGENLTVDIHESLSGVRVMDLTPPPSAEWMWLSEPGAIDAVLADIFARFKRSEITSFLEVLGDCEFPTTTDDGRRANDRHCQGMTRFRKRAVALLAEGKLPRRTRQFLEEFLSRNKCNKRMGSGRRKKEE